MSDFDQYSGSYGDAVQDSIAFSGQDHGFFTEVKADLLVDLARRRLGNLGERRALDLGCGVGLTDARVAPVFGGLVGVDLSADSIAAARARNPGVEYHAYEGERLPLGDAAVDLVFAINVFHHIPPAARTGVAAEMARVLAPGGIAAIFEHNPLNPLTRRAVDQCPFDADAVLLRRGESRSLLAGAGLAPVEARYILFFPWRGGLFRTLERGLAPLPFGAQHYVAARRPGP